MSQATTVCWSTLTPHQISRPINRYRSQRTATIVSSPPFPIPLLLLLLLLLLPLLPSSTLIAAAAAKRLRGRPLPPPLAAVATASRYATTAPTVAASDGGIRPISSSCFLLVRYVPLPLVVVVAVLLPLSALLVLHQELLAMRGKRRRPSSGISLPLVVVLPSWRGEPLLRLVAHLGLRTTTPYRVEYHKRTTALVLVLIVFVCGRGGR